MHINVDAVLFLEFNKKIFLTDKFIVLYGVIYMELYEKIRNIREQKEIKQKDMAKYLHMQPSTYNAYENGKRTISADLLKNICIFLNVSSDDLLDLNIKDSYLSLNKENNQIVNKIKKALILFQNK